MPSHIGEISLSEPTKIVTSDASFDIIPAEHSHLTLRAFFVRKHQEDFTLEVKCKSGCQTELTGNHLVLNFVCIVKHSIEFRIRNCVNVVIKAPHQKLLDDNNLYRYELPIPGFEDIKFKTEFKRFSSECFGVWITNRWSLKINGSFGNFFLNLHEHDNFVNVLRFDFDPEIVRKQIATNTYRTESLQVMAEMEALQKMRIEGALKNVH